VTNALEIEGLYKRFGSHQVLEDFSLEIKKGTIVGLIGPNGSGKSTLLNIVCQLLKADAGQIHLLGIPLHQMDSQARKMIGFCSQNCALYNDLLPHENLDFFARLYGMGPSNRRTRIHELMDDFGLWSHAKTRVGRLSGGWRQRLHIAISMINHPEILILDEPTAAVDASARVELWQLVENLRATGTTILLTTHQLPEAQRLCDRIALMQNGHVVLHGSLPELLASMGEHALVKVQSGADHALMQRAEKLAWKTFTTSGEMSFLVPKEYKLTEVVDALEGIDISSVSIKEIGLEEIYFSAIHSENA